MKYFVFDKFEETKTLVINSCEVSSVIFDDNIDGKRFATFFMTNGNTYVVEITEDEFRGMVSRENA